MFRVTSFEVWKWISSFEIMQTDRLTKFCNKTLPMTGPLCLPLLQKPPQAKAHLKTILWHFSRKEVIQDHMSLGWGLQKVWWYKAVQERIVVKKSFSGKEETESQKNRKRNKFPCFYPEFGEYLRDLGKALQKSLQECCPSHCLSGEHNLLLCLVPKINK